MTCFRREAALAIGNVRSLLGPNSTSHNRPAGPKVLLCAVALGTLLSSFASGQVLEDTLVLPDTFGSLPGPLHMAYDDDSVHARLYIGGEADRGGVLVVDLLTCEKLARIATGPGSTSRSMCPAASSTLRAGTRTRFWSWTPTHMARSDG